MTIVAILSQSGGFQVHGGQEKSVEVPKNIGKALKVHPFHKKENLFLRFD